MLRSPRDPAGRVVWPVCVEAIVTEPVHRVARLAYHLACWRVFAEGETEMAVVTRAPDAA